MNLTSTSEDASLSAAGNRFAAAARVLEEAIAARAFPGCAFGVVANGAIACQGALGRFTYDDDSRPVEPATIYDVASLTKVVAATAAAMLLHQRGALDLEMPLGELLPGFVVGRPFAEGARNVTLRHLLAHSSGLPGYVKLFEMAGSPADLYRACLALPLEAPPGSRAEYSDPGFILLGKAIEQIIGEDLSRWCEREIFTPLGMNATGFTPPRSVSPTIAPTENDTTLRHRILQGEVQDENASVLKGVAGHAGLFSNVPDLLRFSTALFHRPTGTNVSTLFDPATVALFSQRQGPEGSARGLGWDTPSPPSSSGHCFSPHSIGHLGYSGCSLWIDLDAGVSVVLLTNRTWPDRSSQLIKSVRPAFHDAVRFAIAQLCI